MGIGVLVRCRLGRQLDNEVTDALSQKNPISFGAMVLVMHNAVGCYAQFDVPQVDDPCIAMFR